MKKSGSQNKTTKLPPGLVAVKGSPKNLVKLKKWLSAEPDSLASGGSHVKFRNTSRK